MTSKADGGDPKVSAGGDPKTDGRETQGLSRDDLLLLVTKLNARLSDNVGQVSSLESRLKDVNSESASRRHELAKLEGEREDREKRTAEEQGRWQEVASKATAKIEAQKSVIAGLRIAEAFRTSGIPDDLVPMARAQLSGQDLKLNSDGGIPGLDAKVAQVVEVLHPYVQARAAAELATATPPSGSVPQQGMTESQMRTLLNEVRGSGVPQVTIGEKPKAAPPPAATAQPNGQQPASQSRGIHISKIGASLTQALQQAALQDPTT